MNLGIYFSKNSQFEFLLVDFTRFAALFFFLKFQRHRRSPHIWYHLLPTFLGLLAQADSQCFGGVETYEKTSGTTVMCDNASECNIRGLVTQEDTSVTRDCIAICKQSSACTTFTVGKYSNKNIIFRNLIRAECCGCHNI